MSDLNGKGQVAQVARWPATLKASGSLCLLDGRGIYDPSLPIDRSSEGNANINTLPQKSRECHALIAKGYASGKRIVQRKVWCGNTDAKHPAERSEFTIYQAFSDAAALP